ncbi:MAG: type III pantothenate kinase [Planctomycetota bacterium]
MANDPNILAISIGNSRVQIGRFHGGDLSQVERFSNDSLPALVQHLQSVWTAIDEDDRPSVLIASVNEPVADSLSSMLKDQLSIEPYRVGDDLPAPIGRQLDPETITGVDRLLNAAAAYDLLKQACIVVDAGTAVTVDFVDGEGTFHGGAIAPGAQMQLDAMHNATDALPEMTFASPDAAEVFGRSTGQAMLRGVYDGIRGMVWRLVEQYAQHYGAYPTVIATGGDADTLFANDELIDRIVPDLTLHGIAAAARHALAGDAE